MQKHARRASEVADTDLESADDARHDAEHAGVGAPRAALRPRRLRKETPVAGTCAGTGRLTGTLIASRGPVADWIQMLCSVLNQPRRCRQLSVKRRQQLHRLALQPQRHAFSNAQGSIAASARHILACEGGPPTWIRHVDPTSSQDAPSCI